MNLHLSPCSGQPPLLHNHARYDGDGNRVEKSNGTLYWYGLGGEVLEETSLTGGVKNDYVYFDGKRIARHTSSSTNYFYLEDHLGSSRVMTDANGNVCYDADFLPFGQEVDYTNTCAQNYKFEGKERDLETGNDNFGARYYRSALGRWQSPDWSAIPVAVPYANLTNPQTLNLYQFVHDNPETFADLDGHLDSGENGQNNNKSGSPTTTTCTNSGGNDNMDGATTCTTTKVDHVELNNVRSVIQTTTTTTIAADGTKTVTTTTTWVNFRTDQGPEGNFISSTQRINVDEFDSTGKKVASMSTGLAPERLDENGAKAALGTDVYKSEQSASYHPITTWAEHHKAALVFAAADAALAPAEAATPALEVVKKVLEAISWGMTAWELSH